MAQQIFAPWAEPAPGAPERMTVDALLKLPDDGWMYELVEGRLVRMPPSGGGHSHIGVRLGAALLLYTDERALGRVTGADGGYVLSRPEELDTVLAPDVAFVRAERAPPRGSPEYDRPWRVAPDLAAEVASPDQYRPEMSAKALLYLRAGTRLVWIIWPRHQRVDVWRPRSERPVATLTSPAALDGLDVLPGFTYPLERLFA